MEQDIQLGKFATKIKEIFEQHGNGSEIEEYLKSLSSEDVRSLSDEDFQFLLDMLNPKAPKDGEIIYLDEDGMTVNGNNLLHRFSELSKDRQVNLICKNSDYYLNYYKYSSKEAQKATFLSIKDQVKENPELVTKVWAYTVQEAQKANSDLLPSIIDLVKGDPDLVAKVWKRANSVVRLGRFSKVFEVIKLSINREYYEEIVKDYLGDGIEFDEEGNPYVPKDLEKILSTIKDNQQAEVMEKNLTGIIKNWDAIKQYIQQKRANSIVKDGIEIRRNSVNEILNAVKAINRPIANSISAQEFEQIKGAERVGVDTQYTVSPSTAVQRAHTLSEKMDKQSCKKAYSNFSVKNENGIELNVLHPQDKSAILLGHDTRCCFRPNGDADNSANNEYSLLQYCTTTPYGGVLRCESTDKKNIYMGTPFLVNGNCMMFHSYETANKEKSDEINKLLVEAAKKAIENSNGSINIVFMTDLYTGNGRLNTEDKIIIPSYFKPYIEGEYSEYSEMYSNLNCENCILAARVGDKILSGEELVKWYEKECQRNPEELKKTLGLHMGERKQRFDFGRREIEETIEIPKYELVEKFDKQKRDLEQAREDLSIVLQIKKLESKGELSRSEQDELSILKSKIEGKIDMTTIGTIDAIRNEIQQNREKQFALYSGEDIDLIAEVYGLDIQQEVKRRETAKLEDKKKTKDNGKNAEGKAQRKNLSKAQRTAISILLGEIGKSNDEEIKDLKERIVKNTITDDELEKLSQAGIDVIKYRSAFGGNEGQDINRQNNEQAYIKEQVRKIMKDKAKKEEIVSEMLWEDKDISEEEIKTKSKAILRVSLIDELKRKAAAKSFQKGIENLTEREKETVNQEVQMINKDKLVESIINGDIELESQSILENYDIDIENLKEKISNIEKIKHDIKKDKLEKLKAGITLGLETKSKIQSIKDRIDGARSSDDRIAKFIYGLSWYIALDDKGKFLCSYGNTEMDNEERAKYEENLKKYENSGLEKTSIKDATEHVPAEDKKTVISKLEKKENENVMVRGGNQQ